MKLWKYSGTFLTATGIIHTIYALFIGKDAFFGNAQKWIGKFYWREL